MNGADFYDLFGPTKRARAGESGYVNYNLPLVFDPPETMDFTANVAYYIGLDASCRNCVSTGSCAASLGTAVRRSFTRMVAARARGPSPGPRAPP